MTVEALVRYRARVAVDQEVPATVKSTKRGSGRRADHAEDEEPLRAGNAAARVLSKATSVKTASRQLGSYSLT
jgi:hypothetical protein